jgi:Ca2+-binding EF-hand superfamily protein
MGACGSSPAAPKSATEIRLEKALKKKRIELQQEAETAKKGAAVGGKPHVPLTLESVIMKFRKVKHAIVVMKDTFAANTQTDGTLNFDGLVKAMAILHGSMTKNDIRLLFDFVDLDDSKSIEMKEFLVALAVGHCLDMVPEVMGEATMARQKGGSMVAPAPEPVVVNVVSAENSKIAKEIAEMLDLIVGAWILFDSKGKGYIEKTAIAAVMGDAGGTGRAKNKGTGSAMGDEKMKQMDIDNGGTVDFAEFVFSFASWVDIDEDEDE